MRLDTSQQMRTEMRLRMAPRMIQSMEILQLPIMALQERIEQELSENPVLEDLRESAADRGRWRGDAPPSPAEPEPDTEPNEFDSLIKLDENWSEIYDEGPRRSRAALSEESDRKQEAMQNMASRPRSFHDDLTDQLGFFDCDPIVRELAEYIIYNLDEKGSSSSTCRTWSATSTAGPLRTGRGGAAAGPAARPARRRRPRPARVPAPAAHAGHALPRRAPHPDLAAPRRPRAQPPAGHREEDGDLAREDQGGARAPATAQPPAGRVVRGPTTPITSCPT